MYEAVIGLEVHAQLKTKTKAFCGCSTEFGKEPNSQVCSVCLGLPGSLPVLNKTALEYAIKVALALNCKVQEHTKFDRKNYFYPDLPKNYQISQYDLPIALDGFLDIELNDKIKRIGIRRVHLEEDAGKLIHEEDLSLVDFNRTGIPLLEIVSEPDINTPEEAYEYLGALKNIIRYLGVSDCDMEKGSLRCDANISLREKGVLELGVKTELKNMNSFKAVRDALGFEIERQTKILKAKKKIAQETRLWDAKELKTSSMRTKEAAQDYRYFPDPDLPGFTIKDTEIDGIMRLLPELPKEKKERFIKEYNLLESEARLLTDDKDLADYFEGCIKIYPKPKIIFNWIRGALLSELNSRNLKVAQLGLEFKSLIDLIRLIDEGKLSNLSAKNIFKKMLDTKKESGQIIEEEGLVQICDEEILNKTVQEVIQENPKSVSDYKSGKDNAIMFLVGQAMSKSRGRANPKIVKEILLKKLAPRINRR
jgi:aspartyl-tRNA(Asn)/glutamyl-tRNA(Gln) amidotransferase subunit B